MKFKALGRNQTATNFHKINKPRPVNLISKAKSPTTSIDINDPLKGFYKPSTIKVGPNSSKSKKDGKSSKRMNRIKNILKVTDGTNDGDKMWKNFAKQLPRGKK